MIIFHPFTYSVLFPLDSQIPFYYMVMKNDMFAFVEFATLNIPSNYANYDDIIAELDKLYKLSAFYEGYCCLKKFNYVRCSRPNITISHLQKLG